MCARVCACVSFMFGFFFDCLDAMLDFSIMSHLISFSLSLYRVSSSHPLFFILPFHSNLSLHEVFFSMQHFYVQITIYQPTECSCTSCTVYCVLCRTMLSKSILSAAIYNCKFTIRFKANEWWCMCFSAGQ